MVYNSEIHHRRSIRLKGYDYSSADAYFVTVCSYKKELIFSSVRAGLASAPNHNNSVILKSPGKIISNCLYKIPERFKNVVIDEFVIMPNHFHGILIKFDVGAGPCACPDLNIEDLGATTGSRPYNLSLSDVIERFKSLTIKKYIEGIKMYDWQPFRGKLWQRNYYERIIRNEKELNIYRKYIEDNPSEWNEDEYFIL